MIPILATIPLLGPAPKPVYAEAIYKPPALISEIVYEPLIAESVIPQEQIDMLAHLLMGECGADYCTDDLHYYVGSVVLNRIESDLFPDTLEEVIFQPGQYECTWVGGYYQEPTDRCYKIAEELLKDGSVLPSNVVFQAEFMQGDGLYLQEQNVLFCYSEEV